MVSIEFNKLIDCNKYLTAEVVATSKLSSAEVNRMRNGLIALKGKSNYLTKEELHGLIVEHIYDLALVEQLQEVTEFAHVD